MKKKKMKTIKPLVLLIGLALGIASCSKEGQDNPVNTELQSKGATSRDSVLVNFTVGADNTEQLRLAQSLNADGVPVSPFMEEKDVLIRFYVRKSGYVIHTDAVCKKVVGQNAVNYKGGIRLPDLGDGNESTTDFTGYQIAGILLGEANNGTQFVEPVDDQTINSIEQTELLTAEDNVVRSKVPYILDWTTFELNAEGKQNTKLDLNFLPVGNLLRIQFNNQLAEAKTLRSIKVTTNAFVFQNKFDFSRPGKLRGNYGTPATASGWPIEALSDTYQATKTYELPTPKTIESKNKSPFYYIWVMPLKYDDWGLRSGKYSIVTQVVGVDTSNQEYNMLAVCSPLSEGSNKLTASFRAGSTLETAFKGGKLPLWYIADYHVAPDGKSLVNTHTMPRPIEVFGEGLDSQETARRFGFFSFDEFKNINVPGYFLPSLPHLAAAFPSGVSTRAPYAYIPNGVYYYSSMEFNPFYTNSHWKVGETKMVYEEILFPGETNSSFVMSEYKLVEHSTRQYTMYALRFMECGQKEKLTAYRYNFTNYRVDKRDQFSLWWEGIEHSQTDVNYEVSSVFLGSGFTGDINTISTPSFWSRSGVVTRKFPLAGEVDGSTGEHWAQTRSGDLWGLDGVVGLGLRNLTIHWFIHDNTGRYGSRKFLARLVKNEFKTAK